MRNILIGITVLGLSLATLCGTAMAQSDSVATHIVDRYLDILNINALPQDSMLVLTTTVTRPGGSDTVTMRRLFQPPQMFRVDVYGKAGLQYGLYSNGKERFRQYGVGKGWDVVPPEYFYLKLNGYDFRGPLYGWRSKNLMMSYQGKVDVQGSDTRLDAVRVAVEGMYTRIYMFEESGLLSVIVELDEGADKERLKEYSHIEWKCEHEYGEIGNSVLPVVESFMRRGELTVMRTDMHFEKRNDALFNHD